MMAPALGLPVALASFAADTDKTAAQTSAAAKSRLHMRASQSIGKNVENAQGENFGEIKDVVIDVNNERVFCAVLEFGGFLGRGEKLLCQRAGKSCRGLILANKFVAATFDCALRGTR